MKVTTISIPLAMIDVMTKMKETGLYTSKSEIMRYALIDFFKSGGQLANDQEDGTGFEVKESLKGHKIMCLSLPPQLIAKLDECRVNSENDEMATRSYLVFKILKNWLPGMIKLTEAICEPVTASLPQRAFGKKGEFDMRDPKSRQMIAELVENMKFNQNR